MRFETLKWIQSRTFSLSFALVFSFSFFLFFFGYFSFLLLLLIFLLLLLFFVVGGEQHTACAFTFLPVSFSSYLFSSVCLSCAVRRAAVPVVFGLFCF